MINLEKGQKINLEKSSADGLGKTVLVGLGWRKSDYGAEIDCDAFVLMRDKQGYIKHANTVYFNNLTHHSGAVKHMGDNLVGNAVGVDADSEQIYIDLNLVPEDIVELLVCVNIYDCVARGQHFGMIKDAYITLYNKATMAKLVHYKLGENYKNKTAIHVATFRRNAGTWDYEAVGEANNCAWISEMEKQFNPIHANPTKGEGLFAKIKKALFG